MREKLYKSTTDKKIFGVCGGLAEYFGLEVSIVRLLWVTSVIIYGTGIIPYIICAIVMPKNHYNPNINNGYENIDI